MTQPPQPKQPKPFEAAILADVTRHEQEFGRELPATSFYKSLALDIRRKYGLKAS